MISVQQLRRPLWFPKELPNASDYRRTPRSRRSTRLHNLSRSRRAQIWRPPLCGCCRPASEHQACGADRHAGAARGRVGRRDRAAARLVAAQRARRHHRVAALRSRGDAKQECRGPVGVPACSRRNCSPQVTAMARQNNTSKEALSRLPKLDIRELRQEWRRPCKADVSPHLSSELLIRAVAYRISSPIPASTRP